MQLLYAGTDITDSVRILKADIHDTAGGEADSVDVLLSDTDKLWRAWAPVKGDVLEVKQAGFTSGAMFIYFIQGFRGKFVLKAKSIPLEAKTPRTRTWENIRFIGFVGDIARNYGFEFDTYNIDNWLYDRLDQVEIPDLQFLAQRCNMEGYCLKVNNRKIIVYKESALEARPPVLSLSLNNLIGDYGFYTISEGLFSSCLVRYLDNHGSLVNYQYTPANAPAGPVLKANIRAASQSEAQRYAQGLLRGKNKWETWGDIAIKLNTSIAAGNTLDMTGLQMFSGKYFVHSCTHQFLNDKTVLRIRKILEGY
ncbi:MAG: hypothetical protein QHH06_10290 [Clostridiales bacterium]|nr:hypothetical protein [Eubacteriales bacterium]MDH7566854.1 hypothetical protein [Clostridiales bacterium]